MSAGPAAVFLVLLALSSAATVYAWRMLDEATESEMEAAVAQTGALIQREEAAGSAEEARTQTRLAKEATTTAQYQTHVAEHRATEAAHQTRLAAAATTQREAAEEQAHAAQQLEAEARANAAEQQAIATSRRLAAAAQATRVELIPQQDLSPLVSAAAYASHSTFEAKRGLLSALHKRPNLLRILRGPEDKLTTLACTPDGRTLITGGEAGKVIFWEAMTPKSSCCGMW
jgi:hypothetical protein